MSEFKKRSSLPIYIFETGSFIEFRRDTGNLFTASCNVWLLNLVFQGLNTQQGSHSPTPTQHDSTYYYPNIYIPVFLNVWITTPWEVVKPP